MAFADKLQRMRKLNGLSQEQLAEKLTVSRQAISKWEMGAVPDVSNILKVSNFFDCSLDYLMNDGLDVASDYRKQDFAKVESFNEAKEKAIRNKPSLYQCLWVLQSISLCVLLLLWGCSKISPSPIVRQDIMSGLWYTGYLGFIDYHGLYGIVYVSVSIIFLGLTGMLMITLNQHRVYGGSLKYLYFSITIYLMAVLGLIMGTYAILTPNIFVRSVSIVVLVVLYACLHVSNYLAYKHHHESKII